jgi:cytoskeletal protein RodZ
MDPSNCAYRALLKRYCTAALMASVLWPTVVNAQTATQGNTLAPPVSPPSTVPQTISVPGGTTVLVALTEPISSATANVNDQVGVIVKRQVAVNGWIVVPAGANGHATVTAVEHAASNGSGGKLSMSVDWVYSADGGMVQLSTTNHASENGDAKGAASTATLLSWVFLGPLGFFAHNFVRGRDVTIGTDKTFTVFVDHAVHVRATQQTAQGQAFDH